MRNSPEKNLGANRGRIPQAQERTAHDLENNKEVNRGGSNKRRPGATRTSKRILGAPCKNS